MVAVQKTCRRDADASGLEDVPDAVDRKLGVVEVFEDFDGNNGVERVRLPVEMMNIAANVWFGRWIDIEPQIPRRRDDLGVRRALGAYVEDASGIETSELSQEQAVQADPVDRGYSQGRDSWPHSGADEIQHMDVIIGCAMSVLGST